MKTRVISDIFDKDIGHKGFAKFITLAQQDNHEISFIKEYYEKFKFMFDNVVVEFDKSTKDIKGVYEFTCKTVEMRKIYENQVR